MMFSGLGPQDISGLSSIKKRMPDMFHNCTADSLAQIARIFKPKDFETPDLVRALSQPMRLRGMFVGKPYAVQETKEAAIAGVTDMLLLKCKKCSKPVTVDGMNEHSKTCTGIKGDVTFTLSSSPTEASPPVKKDAKVVPKKVSSPPKKDDDVGDNAPLLSLSKLSSDPKKEKSTTATVAEKDGKNKKKVNTKAATTPKSSSIIDDDKEGDNMSLAESILQKGKKRKMEAVSSSKSPDAKKAKKDSSTAATASSGGGTGTSASGTSAGGGGGGDDDEDDGHEVIPGPGGIDLAQICGVYMEDQSKHCTRTLACKYHTAALKRQVNRGGKDYNTIKREFDERKKKQRKKKDEETKLANEKKEKENKEKGEAAKMSEAKKPESYVKCAAVARLKRPKDQYLLYKPPPTPSYPLSFYRGAKRKYNSMVHFVLPDPPAATAPTLAKSPPPKGGKPATADVTPKKGTPVKPLSASKVLNPSFPSPPPSLFSPGRLLSPSIDNAAMLGSPMALALKRPSTSSLFSPTPASPSVGGKGISTPGKSPTAGVKANASAPSTPLSTANITLTDEEKERILELSSSLLIASTAVPAPTVHTHSGSARKHSSGGGIKASSAASTPSSKSQHRSPIAAATALKEKKNGQASAKIRNETPKSSMSSPLSASALPSTSASSEKKVPKATFADDALSPLNLINGKGSTPPAKKEAKKDVFAATTILGPMEILMKKKDK
mmetsp:Transcript_41222/g.106600  ORF Transcript_41222/g.106600 Transcript_41222/m.106600 type:complete len:722 (-) Transcript_41222:1331-3496(-)